MLRSLYSGVSGMTSHQTRLDVVGNNIANVNTYGFKSSSVAFSDIYYQTTNSATASAAGVGGTNPSQVGYGTNVSAITKDMSRASFTSTSSALDCAIAGNGFFQVQDAAGNTFYTRAGNFSVDASKNLVDSNGNVVLGTMNADPTNAEGLSSVAGDSKLAINVPSVFTASGNSAALAADIGNSLGTATVTVSFLKGNQKQNINLIITNSATATEDSVTGYTVPAAPAAATLAITLKNAGSITNPSDLADRINAAIQNEIDDPTTPATPMMTEENFTGGKISIDCDMSKLTNDPSGTLQDADVKLVKQAAVDAIVGTGAAVTTALTSTEDPQTYSDLSSFYVSDDGTIIGTHAILGNLTFGRIDLASFDNVNGLEEAGDSYFSQTVASGKPNLAIAGYDGTGSLASSALEMSNVSLAKEFADLITTQRGFQANARIITTSDEILQELVNLKN